LLTVADALSVPVVLADAVAAGLLDALLELLAVTLRDAVSEAVGGGDGEKRAAIRRAPPLTVTASQVASVTPACVKLLGP
jgi:hypothetical protein